MDRREFAALVPALLACGALTPAEGQTNLPVLESGTFKPGPPGSGSEPKRVSRKYTMGMLKAGNIRLEMHETTQEVGAPHEPVGTHLHSEIWLVREGTVELTTNGVARRMVAGDVGICVAGDKHFIANVGDTPATYFVVTVGPPEP
jgi:mannose-6-phosphate isomerase-like protein (cupin superfamily)